MAFQNIPNSNQKSLVSVFTQPILWTSLSLKLLNVLLYRLTAAQIGQSVCV